MKGIRWKGAGGDTYLFRSYRIDENLHPIDGPLGEIPGCYVFAKRNRSGKWEAIYIGNTTNLGKRLIGHPSKMCIRSKGATHVAIYTDDMDNPRLRRRIEEDLLANRSPPCNYLY